MFRTLPLFSCLILLSCSCEPGGQSAGDTILVAIETIRHEAILVPVTQLPYLNPLRVGCYLGNTGGYQPITPVHLPAPKPLLYGTHFFDPLQRIPIFPNELCPAAMPSDSIVQFARSALTRCLREKLLKNQISLEVTGNAQFLVPSHQLKNLASLVPRGSVQWVVPLQPGLKPDPQVNPQIFLKLAAQAGLTTTPTVTAEENTGAVVEAKNDDASARNLKSWFRSNRVEVLAAPEERRARRDAPSLFSIRISPAHLFNLANQAEVLKIERVPDIQLRAGGTLWRHLRKPSGEMRPLEDRLRGEGEVIGIIDDSLDVRHCFFSSFRGQPRSEQKVRYLQSEIPRSTEAGFHGTTVAGIAAGEDFNDPKGHDRGEAPRARIVFLPLGALEVGGQFKLTT
jgi:hypothetical protein